MIKFKNKNCIAIIPARGGSKEYQEKNIKLFRGKPIIFLCDKNCKKSKCFDKIIVSTDDIQISNIAKNLALKFYSNVPKN